MLFFIIGHGFGITEGGETSDCLLTGATDADPFALLAIRRPTATPVQQRWAVGVQSSARPVGVASF